MKKIKYLLVSSLLVSCILCSAVYADEDNIYTDKEMNKFVREQTMNNITPQYISYVESLIFKNDEDFDFKQKMKNINYYVDLNEKYYGHFYPDTAYAYISRANIYQQFLFPESILNDLKIAEKISEKMTNDYALGHHVYTNYAAYYLQIGEPSKALEYLQKISIDQNKLKDLYRNYISVYSQLKDEKKVMQYYSKLKNEILKESAGESENLFDYYLSLAGWYQSIGKYKDCEKNIEKAEEILSQLDDENKNNLIRLNKSKIMYLNTILDFGTELPLLSQTEDLIEKYGNNHDKENISQYYIDYYRESKQFDKLPKYFKIVGNFYKDFPAYNLALYSNIYLKQIDTYLGKGDTSEAAEIMDKVIANSENIKDFVPALYAQLLLKNYEIKKGQGKNEDAKLLLDKAFEYYKKSQTDNSYVYVDLYKKYGEIFERIDYKTALDYYFKAVEINKTYMDKYNTDLADLYSCIAKNQKTVKDAIVYENKAIEILKHCYGENYVKVYEELLKKYHIYEQFGMQEDADKLLKEINDAVASKVVKGCTISILDYPLSIINSYKAIETQNYQKAIELSDNALSYAKTDNERKDVYRLKYDIYTATGNTIKASGYKKLANID